MLAPKRFVSCIQENLKAKGFGDKRIQTLIDDFEVRAENYRIEGKSGQEADTLAMNDMYTNMAFEAKEKLKRTSKTLSLQAENFERIERGRNAIVGTYLQDGAPKSQGTALARAAVSIIESDTRFNGLSYFSRLETYKGQLLIGMADILTRRKDGIGKGKFGYQRGKTHLPNVVREISGYDTGDKAAKEFAQAWAKSSDLAVDLFNQAGGSMRKLSRYLPHKPNPAKLFAMGQDAWVKLRMETADWNRTSYRDGSLVAPQDRERYLRNAYDTLVSNGVSRNDPKTLRGQGSAFGNTLDMHRLIHDKDGDAWLKVHEATGDGNIFDVLIDHLQDMAHRVATVETFGPNPEMTALNIKSIVTKKAQEVSAVDLANAQTVLKNKFDPMMEAVLRQNPMNPNGILAPTVVGISNLLASAKMGSVVLTAAPGDFVTSNMVSAFNKMGLFTPVNMYMKAFAQDVSFMKKMAAQTGFVSDNVLSSVYSMTRFTGFATHGPAFSRYLSEFVMRGTGMSAHSFAAKLSMQMEMAGMLQRDRGKSFDQIPWRQVMERYGITARDWDDFRTNTPAYTPKPNVEFLSPSQILQTEVPNKQQLFMKFQGMIFGEQQLMVPDASLEASISLKGTTRPDTIPGAILHSFALWKNLPMTLLMIHGRLGMNSPSVKGRVGFFAGMGAALVLAGAFTNQMKEIAQGRDFLPMDNPSFIGKAALTGGAFGIWGDFLTAGVNAFGQGPGEVVAGAPVAFAGDTTNLALGGVFQWAENMGSLSDQEFSSTVSARAVEYASRYSPGSNIWWARSALQRQVFDRLREIADPKAYQKYARQKRKREKDFGNSFWWGPGDRQPARAPSLENNR